MSGWGGKERVDEKAIDGQYTPLVLAVFYKQVPSAELLLQHGADVNFQIPSSLSLDSPYDAICNDMQQAGEDNTQKDEQQGEDNSNEIGNLEGYTIIEGSREGRY
jgi:hypothetical protein